MLNSALDNSTTIAAISTPPGVGGISVIRLSGPDAFTIADKIWRGKPLSQAASHTAHLGTVLDVRGDDLDQCVATVFVAPRSFTGQNTVEFSVHGSRYVQREILASLVQAGATLAQPGQFTRRAFASGRLELTRAEAVADIIASNSRASHRLAMSQLKGSFGNKIAGLRQRLLDLVALMELELDFSEEDVQFADRTDLRLRVEEIKTHIERLLQSFRAGNAIRNGIPVAITGPTNAGKSSLLNALLDYDRAIVSDIHGTTRDTVEETLEVGDYLFRFVDTAGLRDTADPVERLGIERSRQAVSSAHIVLSVIDLTDPQPGLAYAEAVRANLQPHQTHICVYNKSDLHSESTPDGSEGLTVSSTTHYGLDALRNALTVAMDKVFGENGSTDADDVMVTNQRHAEALGRAHAAAKAMLDSLDSGLSTDIVAMDARVVLDALGELTGQITSSEVLATIFSRFCIGK